MKLDDLLKRAVERRGMLFDDPETNCFRLFNAEGDGFAGLTLDRYGEYLLVQLFSSDLFRDEAVLHAVVGMSGSLPCTIRGILLKNRSGERDTLKSAGARSRCIEGEFPPADYFVMQNGMKALVDLEAGQNTGVFLDMRAVRNRILSSYRECSAMLNLFSYTALFSVHAALNGIPRVINVDLSQSALRRAVRNYHLNGIACDDRDFIRGDALQWIRTFRRKEKRFSMIIFDPPTFSRNKKRYFSVLRDYRKYLELLAPVAERYVLSSINTRSVSESQYRAWHPRDWNLVFLEHESDDFRYTRNPYLKAGLWRIAGEHRS